MAGDYCTTGRLSIRPKEDGARYNSWRRDETEVEPERIFQTQSLFTFMDDRAAVLTTPIYGEDNFMWASDYPMRHAHGRTLIRSPSVRLRGQRHSEAQALQRER